MSADSTTRKGKIARLPRLVREVLNTRLLDGQAASEILPWLNAITDVQDILKRHFNGDPVNEQNLTNWRQGGYLEWCEHQAEADRLQSMAEMSMKIVEATGLRITDGAAAIAAGNLLARLEAAYDDDETGEKTDMVIKQIATLRAGDHAVHDGQRKDRKLTLDERKLALKDREVILAEDKFRRLVTEKVFEAATSKEVQSILSSGKPKAVQMQLLALELFGEKDADVAKLTGGKAA